MKIQFHLLKKIHVGALAIGVLSQCAWAEDFNLEITLINEEKISILWESDTINKNSEFWQTYRHEDIRSISFPENVTIIGDHAFSRCESLKSITLPSKFSTLDELKRIGIDLNEEIMVNGRWVRHRYL